jgi:hypothetical protein
MKFYDLINLINLQTQSHQVNTETFIVEYSGNILKETTLNVEALIYEMAKFCI